MSREIMRDSDQNDIQPGDLLKFDKGNFSHYAVYVGDKTVVHQTRDKGVMKQLLKDVIEGCPFFVDNSLDMEIRPKKPSQIVKDALSTVGRQGYCPITSNCEHFATWCRYGKAICKQIDQNIQTGFLFLRSSSSSSSKSLASDKSCAGCLSVSKVMRDSDQNDIQPGDLLKIDRGNSFHYAVYVGYGKILHQTVDKGVIEEPLKDVIEGCTFNSLDLEVRPKRRSQIVEDVFRRVARQLCSLLTSNSEHFAA